MHPTKMHSTVQKGKRVPTVQKGKRVPTKTQKQNQKQKQKHDKAKTDAWSYIKYLIWCYMKSTNLYDAFHNAKLAYDLCISNACSGDYDSLIQLGIWSATGFAYEIDKYVAKLAFEKSIRVLIEESKNDGLSDSHIQELIANSNATYFMNLYKLLIFIYIYNFFLYLFNIYLIFI